MTFAAGGVAIGCGSGSANRGATGRGRGGAGTPVGERAGMLVAGARLGTAVTSGPSARSGSIRMRTPATARTAAATTPTRRRNDHRRRRRRTGESTGAAWACATTPGGEPGSERSAVEAGKRTARSLKLGGWPGREGAGRNGAGAELAAPGLGAVASCSAARVSWRTRARTWPNTQSPAAWRSGSNAPARSRRSASTAGNANAAISSLPKARARTARTWLPKAASSSWRQFGLHSAQRRRTSACSGLEG